jgi:hypothetical protein
MLNLRGSIDAPRPVVPENHIPADWRDEGESSHDPAMLAVLRLLGKSVVNLFRSRRRLEVENLFLRHQLNIALRRAPHRLWLRGSDRAVLVWMTWRWPGLLGMSRIVQPDTILRWHRYLVLWATGALFYRQCKGAAFGACG